MGASDADAAPARNAARTRAAILDAAERLFAQQGFPLTSLQQIGQAAGLSRGTPAYFFGSKEELYRAVLHRAFEAAETAAAAARARALASDRGPEARAAILIGDYVDFLAAHPSFIRLAEREALSGGRVVQQTPPHLAILQDTLTVIAGELGSEAFRPVDPTQLLVSILALCYFPFAHADDVVAPLGLNAHDPTFQDALKRHVVALLFHGLQAG